MAGQQTDGGSGRRATAAVAVALALILLAAACSSSSQTPSGGSSRATTADTSHLAANGGTLLRAPAAAGPAAIAAAATVVQARLARMGVEDAVATPVSDGVAVTGSADAYQLQAAAQLHATVIAPITATALGPCPGAGTPSVGPARRCYTLDEALTGVTAISHATVQSVPGSGWKVDLTIDPTQYPSFRAALPPTGAAKLALLADDEVALAFGSGLPALRSVIGPPLSEDQARRAAAALAIDSDLPISLDAPEPPPPSGARVDVDFWTAALAVDICGQWLPDAPTAGGDTGVHSHGDGLIYIHPFSAEEAGAKATLGLWLERGGWTASADQLDLWDGTQHRSGTTCPDGRTAEVRWWVDGAEQQGDPSEFVPQNGQMIELSLDSSTSAAAAPPQLDALYLPALGPATS